MVKVRQRKDGKPAVGIRTSGRNAELILNPESIKDWDDEELARGQRKDKNGRFTGRPPNVIPKLVHEEFVKRTLSKARHDLIAVVPGMVESLQKIIEGPEYDDKARVQAIKLLMEHVFGKAPQTVEVDVKVPKFQIVLEGGIVPGDLESIDTTARES